MAGMKTRLTRNRTFTSNTVKGIVLFMLAFAVPGFISANDNPALSEPDHQSARLTASEVEPLGSTVEEASGATDTKASSSGVIKDLRITPENGKVTVTVATNRLLTPNEFMLEDSKRLVLDFPNTENQVHSARFPVNTASVKQIRVSQFRIEPSPVARMVFELEEDSGTHEMTINDSSISLVFYKGQSEPSFSRAVLTAPPSAGPDEKILKALKPIVPAADRVSSPAEPSVEIPPASAPAEPLNVSVNKIPLFAALTPAAPPQETASSPSRFSGQPLTLDFVETPLVDFFRLLAEEGGINIVVDPSVKGNITIKVEKLPWDQIFEIALINNSLDKQVEGSLVRVARKATLQEEAKQKEALATAIMLSVELETRVKPLNYAKAASLVAALSDQKTVRGTVVVNERTNSLILTDIPSSIEKQIKLIDQLDIPQPQVEISARIESMSSDFAREIGTQFGLMNISPRHVNVYDPKFSDSDTAPRNYNSDLPAIDAFGGVGASIENIFDSFRLDAALTAGETKGKAKLMSQPRITTQNNTPAEITQGLRFPVPVNANNTVTIQFFNAALTLTVTPQITNEDTILLNLKVENNTPDFGNNVDGVPSIRTSESSTQVLVKNGGTTAIGGILMEDKADSVEKVPGLGSLPLLGSLFRHTSVSKTEQEIWFYVTPRIVK